MMQSVLDVLENCNVSATTPKKQGDQFYIDIQWFSSLGEDVIESVWYDGTQKSFISAFNQVAENFNADDHAAMWYENRGKNGTPYATMREFLNDADGIKATLMEIASQLNTLK